jgi:hypothetical protein
MPANRTLCIWLAAGSLIAVAGLPLTAQAEEASETYSGCVDAQGRPVPALPDPALTRPALAGMADGAPVIRHNASVLPRLTPAARLFLYAHECALHALALPLAEPRRAQSARHADCWALAALQGSGALAGDRAAAELQGELAFGEGEWPLLPGPRRTIDLGACASGGGVRLPGAATPAPERIRANRCVHACGERLWQCQKRCGGADCRAPCEAEYDRCEAGCAG